MTIPGARLASPAHSGPFGAAFDGGIEAMLAIDIDTGAILDANAAAARLLGHDRARLKAMQVFDLHPGQ
ncbi:MAG: hypothetical protein B7Z30_05495, partial [Rhizobiales bacterium 12-68-15]